jgi:hypothetical protein
MRKSGGASSALAIAGMVLAATMTPSDAAHKNTRTAAFDGLWSVSILTQEGPCDPSYRYPARIVGGQIVQADNDFSYQISGVVVSSGAIAVSVSKGVGTATGYGRLVGTRGGGRWSTSNNTCYGTWNAVKRG